MVFGERLGFWLAVHKACQIISFSMVKLWFFMKLIELTGV